MGKEAPQYSQSTGAREVVAHRCAQRQVGHGAPMCVRAYSVHCVRMRMSGVARIQARASTCQWSSAHMLVSAWCAPPHVYLHAYELCAAGRKASAVWAEGSGSQCCCRISQSRGPACNRPAATPLRKPNCRRLCSDNRSRAPRRRTKGGCVPPTPSFCCRQPHRQGECTALRP